jgi:UDP-N-acetylmuramoyl-L-alanyl-D-glutamate--2,6-diaminopimelate ligase
MTHLEISDLLGMTLSELPELEATGVSEDSRKVRPGDIFVAVSGEHADGHDFATDAVGAGAVAILGDRPGIHRLEGCPYLFSERPREAEALLAHAMAGNPTQTLSVIGITGTNGKSSTALLTQSILQEAGYPTSNFGTMGYQIAGTMLPAAHTTPFGDELAVLLGKARDAGDTHVVMEVSSHALDQERVAGIRFAAAAFTNLTQDHLDYHETMGAYRDAKLKLFHRIAGDDTFTVVNKADPAAPEFEAASRVHSITYGPDGVVRARDVRLGMSETRFALATPRGEVDVTIQLLGHHNIQNALCAAAIAYGLRIDLSVIARGLSCLPRVPGRFDGVDGGQDFFVVVDYAHTEDGLKNVLEAAGLLCKGRIITVFGCGGDRDRGKRPKMGKVAGQLSHFCVLTSDNPRSEDPKRILLDVEVGLQKAGCAKGDDYVTIESRAEAIHHAIGLANKGDLVLIAGKGHEDYQILAGETIHFDDRETALQALEARR